jgi:hypothetical protein
MRRNRDKGQDDADHAHHDTDATAELIVLVPVFGVNLDFSH